MFHFIFLHEDEDDEDEDENEDNNANWDSSGRGSYFCAKGKSINNVSQNDGSEKSIQVVDL